MVDALVRRLNVEPWMAFHVRLLPVHVAELTTVERVDVHLVLWLLDQEIVQNGLIMMVDFVDEVLVMSKIMMLSSIFSHIIVLIIVRVW